MNNIRKKLSMLGVLAALISCTCATPLVVSEIQKSDKKLTCKDIILEINESEHYKEQAKKERGIGFGNALMPVCWASSYVDASSAINAANARVAYLGKIYDVLDCGGKSDRSQAAPAGMMPPPFINVQPVQPQYSAPPARAYQPMQAPAQRQAQRQQQIQEDDDQEAAPNLKGEKDVDDSVIRKDSHQHIDKLGKVYTHSHPYAGPHRHAEDQ